MTGHPPPPASDALTEPLPVLVLPDEPPSARAFSRANLHGFWPFFLLALVVAVVFVASVAYSSMNSVGVQTDGVSAPPPKNVSRTSPMVIVQVSSHPVRAEAVEAAAKLGKHGYRARILVSDQFWPLNPGYFVVYVGPYPQTSAGRSAARHVHNKLAGSLIREIHQR